MPKSSSSFNPPMHKGDVHLWYLPFDKVPKGLTSLTQKEKIRQSNFKFEHLKSNFEKRATSLRFILANYIGIPESDISYHYNDFGKPGLINDPSLYFNLSHTKNWFCIAVSQGQPIGCDIEFIDDSIEVHSLLDHYFSSREKSLLLDLPIERHVDAFFNLWTRKEAFIKAIGEGLSFGLDRFSVEVHTTNLPQVLEVKDHASQPEEWSLRSFEMISNNKMSIAVEGEIRKVSLFGPTNFLKLKGGH